MLITGGLFTSGVRLQKYVPVAPAQIASDWVFNATSENDWAGLSPSGGIPAQVGNYLEFTGTEALRTDIINTGTLTNDDYTYEFWVRTTGSNSGALLTKLGTGGYTVSAIEISATTLVPGYWIDPQVYTEISTPITRDEWQHYVVTYTTNGPLKTYYNGQMVDVGTSPEEVSPRDYNITSMFFDLFSLSVTNFGNGGALTADFGEFRLYTRALSDAEVLENYNATEARWRPTGLTAKDAGTSAWQIKQDWPASTNGRYWIRNDNINNGDPFQIYADMTTDGGGWTLIMQNNNDDWTTSNAMLRNSTSPPSTLATGAGDGSANYSIIGWADYIKRSSIGFEYMLEAGSRGSNGGIWTANDSYSFSGEVDTGALSEFGSAIYFGGLTEDVVAGASGFRQNVTLTTKFGTWEYSNDGLERRMPWFNNDDVGIPGIVTTTHDDAGSWWGTLMGGLNGYFTPAPWDQTIQNPQVIWYWVR